jgi:hypothetical protein
MGFAARYVDCRVTGDHARTLTPVVYTGARDEFVIPADFSSDFASVPRLLTWLAPRMGAVTLAALLHDYLCAVLRGQLPPIPGLTAVDADALFRRVLLEEGVPPVLAWIYWAGVRLGAVTDGWHRVGWWSTAWQVAPITVLALPLLAPALLSVAVVLGAVGLAEKIRRHQDARARKGVIR